MNFFSDCVNQFTEKRFSSLFWFFIGVFPTEKRHCKLFLRADNAVLQQRSKRGFPVVGSLPQSGWAHESHRTNRRVFRAD